MKDVAHKCHSSFQNDLRQRMAFLETIHCFEMNYRLFTWRWRSIQARIISWIYYSSTIYERKVFRMRKTFQRKLLLRWRWSKIENRCLVFLDYVEISSKLQIIVLRHASFKQRTRCEGHKPALIDLWREFMSCTFHQSIGWLLCQARN